MPGELKREFEQLKAEVGRKDLSNIDLTPSEELAAEAEQMEEVFDPFLGETFLKQRPAPVTNLDSMPPMRMAELNQVRRDLFDPFF